MASAARTAVPARVRVGDFGRNDAMPSLDTKTQRLQSCSHCGAQLVGGTAGCGLLFKELMGLDFSGGSNRRLHHLVHDAYVLQHPKGQPNHSVAIHLASLCWLVEQGGRPGWDLLPASVLARLSLANGLPSLATPRGPWRLNISHVWGFQPAEVPGRVEAWAKSVWEAWQPYHSLARTWLNGAGH